MMQKHSIEEFKVTVEKAIRFVFNKADVLSITAPIGYYHVSKYITFVIELHEKEQHKNIIALSNQIAFEARLRKKDVSMYMDKGDIIVRVALPKELWRIINFMDYDGNAIGVTEDNELIKFDFVDSAPHTIVGGSSGSGKTSLMKSIVASALIADKNLDLYIIDPHGDFSAFKPLCKKYVNPEEVLANITDNLEAEDVLCEHIATTIQHVVQRFRSRQRKGIKFNEASYRESILNGGENRRMVLVIDEALASFVFGTEDTKRSEWNEANLAGIKSLATESRKYGVNLIIGTQKPKHGNLPDILDNLTNLYIGILKPAQMATVLLGKGSSTANLQGNGDFIWQQGRTEKQIQSTLISDTDIKKIVRALCPK